MTFADTSRHTLALLAVFAIGCSMSHTDGPSGCDDGRCPPPPVDAGPGEACGATTCGAGETCCTGGCGEDYCTYDDFCAWPCADAGPPDAEPPPPPPPGGCFGGPHDECDPDAFCRFDGCGGDGTPGRCEARPTACPFIYAPVCGCDGVTYENDCAARAVGANVVHPGECGSPPASCGGETGPCVDPDTVCDWDHPGCGAGNDTGTCVPRSDACPDIYAPVCGCDGETYGNGCEAHALGVEVDHEGTCDAPPGRPCGGWVGSTCDDDEFCDYADDWCDWADASGVCRPRPTDCLEPGGVLVCGCDGEEYIGECAAQLAGVDVAFIGSCADP